VRATYNWPPRDGPIAGLATGANDRTKVIGTAGTLATFMSDCVASVLDPPWLDVTLNREKVQQQAEPPSIAPSTPTDKSTPASAAAC
jgi:hypothetical protein